MPQQQNSMHFSLRIIVLGLLAFLLFNSANYYYLSTSSYQHLSEENKIYSETVALSVASFLEMAFRLGSEMSQDVEIQNSSPQKQQSYLLDRFSQQGLFENLILQRVPDGAQTARVRGLAAAHPDRWWFQQMLRDPQPFISPSFYSFSSDQQSPATVIGLFFPIFHDDALSAVLAALIRVDGLQERVGQFYRSDGRYVYVLDQEGTVVVHPDSQQTKEHYNYKLAQKTLVARNAEGHVLVENDNYQLTSSGISLPNGLQEAAKSALNGAQGTVEYKAGDGETFFCTYAPIRLPGYSASWAILTVQDKNLALAPLRNTALTHGLLSFLIFAGLSVLLLRQSRAIDLGTQQLRQTNSVLQEEVSERVRAEVDLTAANEELVAMNEELLAVTDELHRNNDQLHSEIRSREEKEAQLRLRERQHQAMVQLLADNTAALDAQLQSMLDSALQLADAQDGHIAFWEEKSMHVRYASGSHTAYLGRALLENEGLFPQLLATRKLQYVEDYQAFSNRINRPPWNQLRTAIMVPLTSHEQLIGCLTLTWQDAIRPLALDEQGMLQQYADLAVLALQGAQLQESLQSELAQRKKLHEEISRIAFQDALTGLQNRASLMARLEEELRPQQSALRNGSIFFVDLDDLKSINDNFGHFAGDTIIIASGQKLSETLANYNAFIARLGGDEFIALLPGCVDPTELSRLADLLVQNLCHDYLLATTTVRVSGSIGIASYPRDGASVEELIKKADNAMYAAKAAGRNCWRFFEDDMLREAQEKLLLTNSLRRALENDELALVFQPQLSLADNRLAGFEALLRWQSPTHGNVSPARFIPLAEQSQLIIPIGAWVLQQACLFLQTLAIAGYGHIRVAVNLSSKQLADGQIVATVRDALTEAGIAPQQLELEITESALLTALDESCSKLQQLKNLGVSLALDDFGTGYSSITHLRLFPVEILKIDKSFIDTIITQEDDSLVNSLIHFAQSLKLQVVAEGVETQEQLEYLRHYGCDLIQGYYFSRPLPADEALLLLKKHVENRII